MEDILLKGEKVLLETKPHPLSFLSLYVYFIYFIIVNGLILYYWDSFVSYISSSFIGALGSTFVIGSIGLIWWIVNIIPAFILSIVRISWRWVITYFIFALILSLLTIYHYISIQNMFHIMVALAVMGILLVDVYRRAHHYYITNYRIITYSGFMGTKVRDIFYNRITDVVLEQGFVGRVFNFGSVIPLTAAGIGTGRDTASVSVGVGGGEKTPIGELGGGIAVTGGKDVTVPRGRSSFILFGVPDPSKVRNVIVENMKNTIEAYKLDRIIDILEDKDED